MEIHLCRFVKSDPRGVHCLAFSGSGHRLAVSRSDGDIEIWAYVDRRSWQQLLRFPGGGDASVESLVWVGEDRLISAGLNALLCEWDFASLTPRTTAYSYGGAVWALSLAPSETRLAAGCEDGCVRLFDVSASGVVEFLSSFGDWHEARVLSLCWSRDSSQVISGSADGCIRVYDATTGRSRVRITVLLEVERVLVWSVASLPDGTVCSGDSSGYIRLWDTRFGTQIQSFHLHEADVLAVVASARGDSIFASGVDNRLVQLRLVGDQQWALASKSRAHTHDVRALALSGNLLISAGVDTALILYDADDITRWPYRKLPPLPHYVSTCAGALSSPTSPVRRLLLSQLDSRLQLWQLGETASSAVDETLTDGTRLALSSGGPPVAQLLELRSKNSQNLVCSALSPDGSRIAMSDAATMRVFAVDWDDCDKAHSVPRVVVRKLRVPNASAAHRITFTPDSKRMIVGTLACTLEMWDVSGDHHVELVHTFSMGADADGDVAMEQLGNEGGQGDDDDDDDDDDETSQGARLLFSDGVAPIVTLAVSADGQWLMAGDLNDRLCVFNLDQLALHWTLPRHPSSHCAVAIHPRGYVAAVACCSQEICLYNIEEKRRLAWPGTTQTLPKDWLRRRDKIIGMNFDPLKPSRLLLFDHLMFTFVDISQPLPDANAKLREVMRQEEESVKKRAPERQRKGGKKKKGEGEMMVTEDGEGAEESGEDDGGDGASELASSKQLVLVKRFQPLLGVHFISNASASEGPHHDGSALAVVQRPWLAVMESLPPTLYRVRFGT